jgi:hypothetical protein
MYRGTNEITNKGLGFNLTNSTSFGEPMISAGFNQKPSRRTYMLELIMQFCHETSVGRF